MTIGILGLGLIGSIWARHYHAAGALTGVWNRTPQPDFPNWKTDPAAVAAGADVVQIVVADPPAVRDLISRILPALGPGKIVVQSSTIDPGSSQEFEALVVGRGARYLEAPFTGSKPAAEQRQTVYYLGGDRGLIAELEPLAVARVLPSFCHRKRVAGRIAQARDELEHCGPDGGPE
jgi:3-hydroxyisobutyrate dehydrogenase-like beta-hydroxyacid dehydrogenase